MGKKKLNIVIILYSMTISEYNMIEYMNEATNNYDKALNHIQENGSVDLGCVYCVKIYKCFTPLNI